MSGGTARKPRPVRAIVAAVVVTLIVLVGGLASCQAARMTSPQTQCEQSGGIWVGKANSGTGFEYCDRTPKTHQH